MELTEALKKVRTEKPKEHFMVFQLNLNYQESLLVPFKEGMALLQALSAAEVLSERYSEPHRVVTMQRDVVTTRRMPYEEYELFKLAALLNLKPEEVKALMEEQNKPPEPVTS